MLWICTNAHVDWNAISAVGTGAAALIALTIWLVDRHDKKLKLRADGRLAAQLVYTETMPIVAVWATIRRSLEEDTEAAQQALDRFIANTAEAQYQWFIETLPKTRSERLERMLESNSALPLHLSEAVADMLAARVFAVESGTRILSDATQVALRLGQLRASVADAFEAARRTQSVSRKLSREGRVTPNEAHGRTRAYLKQVSPTASATE